jgi:hypothetical protein
MRLLSFQQQQNLHNRRSHAHSKFRISPVSISTSINRSAEARVASNNAGSVSSLTQSVAADAAAVSGCPFTALKTQLTGVGRLPQKQHTAANVSVPGPAPFSFESLGDVGTIFFEGLHVAMLKFDQKYGPVCRYVCAAVTASGFISVQSKPQPRHNMHCWCCCRCCC